MDAVDVQCPYCGEHVLVCFEPDVQGMIIQDCEVCCRPWRLQVTWSDGSLSVQAERAQ